MLKDSKKELMMRKQKMGEKYQKRKRRKPKMEILDALFLNIRHWFIIFR